MSVLHAMQFCDFQGNPLPCFKYLRFSQVIITKKVNVILKNLSKQWMLGCNRIEVKKVIWYVIRNSLAKLYSVKYRLGSTTKVFKKYGLNLSRFKKDRV